MRPCRSSKRARGTVAKYTVPEAVIDLFERDVFTGERFGEKNGLAPGNRSHAGDAPDFHMPGIHDGRHRCRQGPPRRRVVGGRRLIAERFVRPLVVVLGAEAAESMLLRVQVRGGRPGGVGFEDGMKLFMRPVLIRAPGAMRSGTIPSRIHQTARRDNRPSPIPANGPPLSLRIRWGKPYSANARAKRRCVASRVRPSNPSHRNTKRLNPSRSVNG